MSDKDTVGVSFASDWLRGRHEFSKPITEGNKRKKNSGLLSTLNIKLLCQIRKSLFLPNHSLVVGKDPNMIFFNQDLKSMFTLITCLMHKCNVSYEKWDVHYYCGLMD